LQGITLAICTPGQVHPPERANRKALRKGQSIPTNIGSFCIVLNIFLFFQWPSEVLIFKDSSVAFFFPKVPRYIDSHSIEILWGPCFEATRVQPKKPKQDPQKYRKSSNKCKDLFWKLLLKFLWISTVFAYAGIWLMLKCCERKTLFQRVFRYDTLCFPDILLYYTNQLHAHMYWQNKCFQYFQKKLNSFNAYSYHLIKY
jgi:hypothetical protein